MKRIGILGDIGSGKSYLARYFGYPVFNADNEVSKLYKNSKTIFNKLNKVLPKYIKTFPVNKDEIISAILAESNLEERLRLVRNKEIKKKLNLFLKKNKNKKIIILDIPLLLENKINKRGDILVFVESKKKEILKRLKKRSNYNQKLLNKFKKIQLSLDYKKKKSNFVIKNDFNDRTAKNYVKIILNHIYK